MIDHYPTTHDADEAIAEAIGTIPEETRTAAGSPPAPIDAARWLRNHVLESPQREESPRRTAKGEGWVWPYIDRAALHGRMFYALSEIEQRYLLVAREDGIVWRGDDMEFFRLVVDEYMRMRDMGLDAYRAEAIRRLRAVGAGPQTPTGEAA